VTDARATQVAVEEWGATNPPARITQVAIEEWASVAVMALAQVTQVAIEEWASVSTVTAPTRPPQFAVSVIT